MTASLPQESVTTQAQTTIPADCQELTFSLPEAMAIQNATVEADTLDLTSHLQGFSVTAGNSVTYSPPTLSADFVVLNPTIAAVRNVTASVDPLELTFSLPAVTIDLAGDTTIEAELLEASLSLLEATVTAQKNVTYNAAVIELGGYPKYILVDGQYARRVVGRYYVRI